MSDELQKTDPRQVQLPVVGPRAPHDAEWRPVDRRALLEITPHGQAPALGLIGDVGQVEDKVAGGAGPRQPRKEARLIHALVPGAEVLRVEAHVERAEPRQRRELPAQGLPRVPVGRDLVEPCGDDARLGRAVRARAREVQLGEEGLDAQAEDDIADGPRRGVGG